MKQNALFSSSCARNGKSKRPPIANGNGQARHEGLAKNGAAHNGSFSTKGNHKTGSHPTAESSLSTNGALNHSADDQAPLVTALLMSLMRDLFAVDDLASELPLRQLRVCALLHEGARSMTSLSRELGVSLSAMTQIADRLERARLVKRAFEGTDRRVRCLQLTPRAQRIMRHRENSRLARTSAALSQLSADDRALTLTTLQSLATASAQTKKPTNGSVDHKLAAQKIL